MLKMLALVPSLRGRDACMVLGDFGASWRNLQAQFTYDLFFLFFFFFLFFLCCR